MIGLARGIARDIPAERDVRINVIMSAASTQMSEGSADPVLAELLSPSKVAPVVGWLASEACTESGMMFQAGAGRVTRARVLETAPVDIADDDVADDRSDLDDMTGAVEAAISHESGGTDTRARRPVDAREYLTSRNKAFRSPSAGGPVRATGG